MIAMEADFVGSSHSATDQIQISNDENANANFKSNRSDDTVLIKEELLDVSACGFQGRDSLLPTSGVANNITNSMANQSVKIAQHHPNGMNPSTEKQFSTNPAMVLPTSISTIPNQSLVNPSHQSRRDIFQAGGGPAQHTSNGLVQQGGSPFNISILPPITSIPGSIMGQTQVQTSASTPCSLSGFGDSQVAPYARKSMNRFNNIQMRYSFTPEQKMILHKHFETGMTGQSLAYQGKIMECALEAGVEFDVVRNWIGNMRRKERMAAAQQAYMENRASNMAANPALASSVPGMPPPKLARMDILPPQPLPMRHRPSPATYANQPGVVPSAPNIRPVGMVPLHSLSVVSGSSQPDKGPAQPQAGWLGEGSPSTLLTDGRNGHPSRHPQMMSAIDQQQMHVQAVIEAIKSHMQILQTMGCECVMAAVTPFENKALIDNRTLITGTTKGVQYFAQIQKMQPFAEFVKAEAMFGSDDDDLSIGNESLSDEFDDVAVNDQQKQQQQEQSINAEGGKDNGRTSADQSNKCEEKNQSTDFSSANSEVTVSNGQVIQAGEEVLIVNKDHHIIGNGFLLPSPHKKIELKTSSN
ncbi:uncharacterized protein LOC117116670 [Anneissia japonica]|uniref:uncharacterized protein LOC117116670 n=1 Tax=Anneissia japonica TaxID=1529436 RepID=UPI00142590DB|nr:uncharacterized protein LOC117116670 [Anneissia japonica]